ncbi:MAG: response regulator [Pseudomonadales bacterium]|nr:response regulator [Pseudomonadales bacterium]
MGINRKLVDLPMVTGEWLTPNEVAELLMVSPVTVRQWAQKGLIEARTTPGGHRRFSMDAVRQFAIREGMASRLKGKLERAILVVDDDKQLNRFLVELFRSRAAGTRVESAFDGFEAGSKLQVVKPDVVILDLMMPGMDGFEVCEKLKSDVDTMHIHVVAMTGYASEENERRIMAAGADRFLRKPFSNMEVLEACGFSPRRAENAG